jgi:hypothetical protein
MPHFILISKEQNSLLLYLYFCYAMSLDVMTRSRRTAIPHPILGNLHSGCSGRGLVAMRIFVQPCSGDSFDLTIRNAVEILQTANILSARAGGTMNDRAVVLIDSEEILKAIALLAGQGLRASLT